MCSKVNKFTQVQGDGLHVNNVGRVEGPSGNMGTSLCDRLTDRHDAMMQSVNYCNEAYRQWQIREVVPGTHDLPSRSKFFHFHAIFGKNYFSK